MPIQVCSSCLKSYLEEQFPKYPLLCPACCPTEKLHKKVTKDKQYRNRKGK